MSANKNNGNLPVYLSSLDIARGIAALAVVLWHWQHFFFDGSMPGKFEREAQPFYEILFIFYEKGWLAVDFFFALSGFIFFVSILSRFTKKLLAQKNFLYCVFPACTR